MLRPFDFHAAETVPHAVSLKQSLGEGAAFYAGGTELVLVLKEGLVQYDHLINLKGLRGLGGIGIDTTGPSGPVLRIGALVRHAALAAEPLVRQHLPVLSEMAAQIGNMRVRAAGTLGGNLAFAEPRSDPGALLLALAAAVVATGPAGERRIRAADFWLGPYATALHPAEVLTAVEIPLLPPSSGAAFRKFAVAEFPTASVAAVLHLDAPRERVMAARLAVAAVNPQPSHLSGAEAGLAGQPVAAVAAAGPEAWAAAAGPDLDPVDDPYGSAEYKQHLVGVLLRDAVREALGLAGARGVA